jgi:hypothetical protein
MHLALGPDPLARHPAPIARQECDKQDAAITPDVRRLFVMAASILLKGERAKVLSTQYLA